MEYFDNEPKTPGDFFFIDIETFDAFCHSPWFSPWKLENNEKDENSFVPLNIIEHRVFGWLDLPWVRWQRHTVKKGIIKEKKGFAIELYSLAEKQMGRGRRKKLPGIAGWLQPREWKRKGWEMRETDRKNSILGQTMAKRWCNI